MIIGIDASRANRKFKSGTEWYSYNIILELAKIDQKNRYFLYSPDKLRDDLANLPQNFYEKILFWPPKFLWTMLRLSWEMRASPPDLLFVPAHIIPLVSPKKTVTTICDVGFTRFPLLYSNFELRYHNFGLKQALKKASKILTISNFTKNEIVDVTKIDPKRIEVIYLGFSSEIYYPRSNRARINQVLGKYKISSDTPYIIYIGRLEQKKNTPGLIKAFYLVKHDERRAKDYKLVLVGSPGFGFSEVKENIRKLKLENEVIILGWVKNNDLPYLLGGADLFVFPSFYEGFGLPLLEAMACGIPVCASNAASIPEIAGEAALYFNPYLPEDMAQKISEILKNQDLSRKLINLGFSQVKKFSWRKCAQKTLEVFNSLS